MAQPPLQLIIGNYNTSSWSLCAWLVLGAARLAFVETRIPLRLAETPDRIGQYSPSGKLPVLLAEGVPIWDSLAIAEFVAELEPGIWPLDPIARAEARSISAEIHSGFGELRRLMPMDVVGRFNAPGRLPRGLAADIRRVTTICEHCRARFAPQGPFLFGAFSITDAMMAPIATRLVTHGVPLAGAVEDYVDSVMAWPDMVTWCDAAAAEQAEREATGSLAVVSVTRPGRILGPEPPAAEAAPSAERPDAGDNEPATPAVDTTVGTTEPSAVPTAEAAAVLAAQPTPLPVEPVVPSRDQASRASMPRAGESEPGAPSIGEPSIGAPSAGEPEAGEAEPGAAGSGEPSLSTPGRPEDTPLPLAPARSPDAADAASPDVAPPVAPPRRRLFEPAPPDGTETAGSVATTGADAAPVPRAVAEPEDPPARKLGWLRHGVPAEHFDALEERLPGGETPDAAHPEPAAVPPAAPGADPDAGRASEQPRRPPATRPGAPAIKPIGGGIHRRR